MVLSDIDFTTDEAARNAILADSKGFLKSHGVELADNVTVHVFEDTASELHFALPADLGKLGFAGDDPASAVLKRAAADADFKARLLAEPAAAAREAGVSVPEGMTIKVYENSATALHIALPQLNVSGELSDADLEMVAGGKGGHHLKRTFKDINDRW
ncbi:MAG: NHLP leader peptide family RiPP precursor [Alphaproteobacteria bacterium]|jgi:hypothetical protein|nr:NHLP leader peptide family RiPP precursor [Alphaproteobacteria bacterium]